MDRVEVDTETKPVVSIIRKIILKALQNPEAISDIVRCRIILPAFISSDRERLIQEIEKAVGIILSEFGTDYDRNRVRYTIETGGSNAYSKGKHRGVHLTTKMRFRIPETGIYADGSIKEGACDIEVQVLGYMTKAEEEEDHREYVTGKTEDVKKELGVDLSFKDFIIQLAEVVSSKYDFEESYSPKPRSKIGNLPFIRRENYREKLLFLHILTKRDENGSIINQHILAELLRDPDAAKILLEAVKKLKNQKKHEVTLESGKVFDITRSIREKAKEAEAIISSKDFGSKTITFTGRKTKSGNWHIRRHIKIGDISFDSNLNWELYSGPLYMIKEDTSATETKFYTVSSKIKGEGSERKVAKTTETDPILSHVIRGKEYEEKCYEISETGAEILLWERRMGEDGTREFVFYNGGGGESGIKKDTEKTRRKNLTPLINRNGYLSKGEKKKREAITRVLTSDKRAKPKTPKAPKTLVFF